jgi:hypothetical protein
MGFFVGSCNELEKTSNKGPSSIQNFMLQEHPKLLMTSQLCKWDLSSSVVAQHHTLRIFGLGIKVSCSSGWVDQIGSPWHLWFLKCFLIVRFYLYIYIPFSSWLLILSVVLGQIDVLQT